MFPLGDVDHWTSVKGEVEACIILNHLFPETGTGTYTHLIERLTAPNGNTFFIIIIIINSNLEIVVKMC